MKTGRFCCFVLIPLVLVAAGCAAEGRGVAVEPKPATVEPPGVEKVQAVPKTAVLPAATAEPATQAPQITFEESAHDFGSVGPSTSHTFDFTFTNTGNAVLKIERFHAPCGCTIPELAKREYEPGESGIIKVRYNAPAGAAVDNKPIYVYTNDPKTPQYELTVKAKVEVNVAIAPQEVSLLLDQDNAGMPRLTVTSKDGKEFAITSITSTNNVIQVPFDRNHKATRIELTPQVDIAKLDDTPTGMIQVRTSHPQSGMLTVRFTAKPAFEVSRPRIILQNIVPGEEVVRDVWIRSNYDQKVEIESFSSTNGMMTIESQQEEGNHLQVMVKITAPSDVSTAGRRYITDELKIHLAGGQELSIRCSGWFRLQ